MVARVPRHDRSRRGHPRLRRTVRLAVALLAWAGVISASQEDARAAQPANYPSKPIRVVAPFTPGGGSDLVARIVAQRLTDAFRQPCIVENRAGAGGRVGTEYVARATPDGYTLLLTGSGSVIFASALYDKLPYDAQRDLAPVTTVASSSLVLVVHPAVPVQSVRQLVALARAQPGRLNYASSGAGAPAHLAAELFQASTKVKLTHVPYKGTAPSIASVMAGETDLTFGNMLTIVPPVQSGKLRALGVSALKRSELFPD